MKQFRLTLMFAVLSASILLASCHKDDNNDNEVTIDVEKSLPITITISSEKNHFLSLHQPLNCQLIDLKKMIF